MRSRTQPTVFLAWDHGPIKASHPAPTAGDSWPEYCCIAQTPSRLGIWDLWHFLLAFTIKGLFGLTINTSFHFLFSLVPIIRDNHCQVFFVLDSLLCVLSASLLEFIVQFRFWNTLTKAIEGRKGFVRLTIPGYSASFQGTQDRNPRALYHPIQSRVARNACTHGVCSCASSRTPV